MKVLINLWARWRRGRAVFIDNSRIISRVGEGNATVDTWAGTTRAIGLGFCGCGWVRFTRKNGDHLDNKTDRV